MSSSSAAPSKYVKVNGIPKLNPAYTKWQEACGQATSSLNKEQQLVALPVVATPQDFDLYNSIASQDGDMKRKFCPVVTTAMDSMRQPDYAATVGIAPNDIVSQIAAVFAKYEIPIGLLTKLEVLRQYESLVFLVDDSGSMASSTDSRWPNGPQMTRWEEVLERIKTMLDVLSYCHIPPIVVTFLNRRDVINLMHLPGQSPQQFFQDSVTKLSRVFAVSPSGNTPFRERIKDCLEAYPGRKVVRYFFGDGVPNGGFTAIQAIITMIKDRPYPIDNPITFMSCTDEDTEVEWMKECEEVAPFCAEYDDYEDEKREVLNDQGQAFPFTKGFYLIALIVGAMNPDDLDAMDESCPMTKFTLDNLLGIEYSQTEYMVYFNHFMTAQQKKRRSARNRVDWRSHVDLFLNTPGPARMLPVVQEYKRKSAKKTMGRKKECVIL